MYRLGTGSYLSFKGSGPIISIVDRLMAGESIGKDQVHYTLSDALRLLGSVSAL